MTFKTEIVLGNVYKHKYSKIKGTAMSVHFYLHGCCRVGLLPQDSADNNWLTFDEAELVNVKAKDPGGPQQRESKHVAIGQRD